MLSYDHDISYLYFCYIGDIYDIYKMDQTHRQMTISQMYFHYKCPHVVKSLN